MIQTGRSIGNVRTIENVVASTPISPSIQSVTSKTALIKLTAHHYPLLLFIMLPEGTSHPLPDKRNIMRAR